jgi:hypothetical protein
LSKLTVPKLSSGSTPFRTPLGASTIHSADEFDDVYATFWSYDWPVVLFLNKMSQLLADCSAIETLIESPGLTFSGTFA